jgi:hypothetical protein
LKLEPEKHTYGTRQKEEKKGEKEKKRVDCFFQQWRRRIKSRGISAPPTTWH